MIVTEIRTREELVELVNEIGFLPFFSGRIEGFSLEENISYGTPLIYLYSRVISTSPLPSSSVNSSFVMAI